MLRDRTIYQEPLAPADSSRLTRALTFPLPGNSAVSGVGAPGGDHHLGCDQAIAALRPRARGTRRPRPVRRQAVISRRSAPRPRIYKA
jgi:hypothetical protein